MCLFICSRIWSVFGVRPRNGLANMLCLYFLGFGPRSGQSRGIFIFSCYVFILYALLICYMYSELRSDVEWGPMSDFGPIPGGSREVDMYA